MYHETDILLTFSTYIFIIVSIIKNYFIKNFL